MSDLNITRIRHVEKQQQVFSREEELFLARQMKALAHPVRLQILQSLGGRNNFCCGDFCASIPLAQSTISQHLKILSKAGIIDYQPVGNCSHYSLNPAVLTQTINALSKLGDIAEIFDSCECSEVSKQHLRAQKKPNQNMDNQ
ncbi:MAG: helix-turn-helix transcriptional regulator [Hyphomicrobiales bacterium]|nr:helix-turn-helix transcriptional regulator [Hyphomicrobiales bacterium]